MAGRGLLSEQTGMMGSPKGQGYIFYQTVGRGDQHSLNYNPVYEIIWEGVGGDQIAHDDTEADLRMGRISQVGD